MSKQKIKQAAKIWVPQSNDEVAEAIKDIGDASREMVRLTADMNDEIAVITARYQPYLDAKKERLELLQNGVQVFCEANRDKLTNGGKVKSANFVTGSVMWRSRPPRCAVRNEEGVLDMFKKLGLARFIRQKEEVNKEAILAEAGAVSGIAGISVITGVEDFVIEPFEQEAV
jgi:phage host-nuclease inhibitor protein Gam